MKIQLTNADEFPADLRINKNPECVYYVNHHVKLLPGAAFGVSCDGLCKTYTVEFIELIECLPGVYTRVLKTNIDVKGTDWTNLVVTDGAISPFTTIAAYLNAWNEFIRRATTNPELSARFVYTVDGGYFSSDYTPSERDCPSLYDWLPDGRTVKVVFYYYTYPNYTRVDSFYDLDGAYAFSFEIVNELDGEAK